MNDYDTSRMYELLAEAGWQATSTPEAADLVVLNSCAIREKSEHKLVSEAGRYRELKGARPDLILAVGGCVAQQEGERLLQRAPMIDFSFGPDMIPQLAEMVARHENANGARERFAATEVIDVEDYRFLSANPRPQDVAVTALVTIQKGCDNYCAYCIVPATRGKEVSRPADEVVAEVARFVELGAREVTLVGQNVNSYHGLGSDDGDDFAALLARVAAVPGLLRLRYTTSHPKDFTSKVALAHRDLPTLSRWVHLPVQAGSSRTLKRMVREYTREQYLAKVDELRALVPDISLSTDIIVGYPGETDADFAETMSLLEEVEYDFIYSFEYSPRPDTPALKLRLRDDVPAETKRARLLALQALQAQISRRRLSRWVGRTVEVLVEGKATRSERELCGRTTGNEMVNFPLPDGVDAARVIGQMVNVHIRGAGRHTLLGEIADLAGLATATESRAPIRRLAVIG